MRGQHLTKSTRNFPTNTENFLVAEILLLGTRNINRPIEHNRQVHASYCHSLSNNINEEAEHRSLDESNAVCPTDRYQAVGIIWQRTLSPVPHSPCDPKYNCPCCHAATPTKCQVPTPSTHVVGSRHCQTKITQPTHPTNSNSPISFENACHLWSLNHL